MANESDHRWRKPAYLYGLLLSLLVASTGCMRSLSDVLRRGELPGVPRTAPLRSAEVPLNAPLELPEIEAALRTMSSTRDEAGATSLEPIDGWYRKLSANELQPLAAGEFRWQHAALAEFLQMHPQNARPLLKRASRSKDKHVQAVAVIALARIESPPATVPLVKIIRDRNATSSLRCAAVETLAREQSFETEGQLQALVEQLGAGESGVVSDSQLYAELLTGLARHVEAASEPRFIEALGQPDPDVLVAVLSIYHVAKVEPLPSEVEPLQHHVNARVRRAAIVALATCRGDAALPQLQLALRDTDLTVRLAAIEMLGQLSSRESMLVLYEVLNDKPERHREAAATALIARSEWTGVERAARDVSYRVRAAVATGLREHGSNERVELARGLLNDSSAIVQANMAEALAGWPVELAGPMLLTGLASPNMLTRTTSLKSLVTTWPESKQFIPAAPAAERARILQSLTERWQKEHPILPSASVAGTTSEVTLTTEVQLADVERLFRKYQQPAGSSERWLAQKQLEKYGRDLLPIIERLAHAKRIKLDETAYRELLPAVNASCLEIEKLRSPDVAERRTAARTLAAQAQQEPLPALAMARLEQVARTESDALVWADLLRVVSTRPSVVYHELALAALAHGEPDVRRRGCEYLATTGTVQESAALLKLLEDRDPVVCKAAVVALGRCGPAETSEPLYQLLAGNDLGMQIAAAKTLSQWRDERGSAALERLALAPAAATRRLALIAMGEVADDEFLPAAMQALRDQPSVQLAALGALPAIAGEDALATRQTSAVSAAEKAKVWQTWYDERQVQR
ncbi:MAG TPA: HEAT repeat domain-containing protein [Pirellulaceae bacterium]|nr:HEAT repeat domain-containing protein [Pirellulaceae bacterium]